MAVIEKFTFKKISEDGFGIIRRPYATVLIQGVNKEWYPVEMVVDTGADYTLMPRRYASFLGIDLNRDCIPKTSIGIGGSETVYLFKFLKVRLNKWQQNIPVGFLERDDIPALLGRLKFIEALKVTFHEHQTIFEI